MTISTHLQKGQGLLLRRCFNQRKTNVRRGCVASIVLRGRLGDVPHAEQGVGAVRTAEDARGENDGQRVGRHAIVGLVFTHPGKVHWM